MEELGRKSVQDFIQSEKSPIVVVLDNVRSMHNVGSIFRTADAFLIQKIFLCGYTPRPPHRDIHKTALGATETVAWEYKENITECMGQLREAGYRLVAVEQAEGSILLPDFECEDGKPLAVIFGNEVEGVQDAVLAGCTSAIEIPQMGTKHSLNVSVAAGIVLCTLAMKMKY